MSSKIGNINIPTKKYRIFQLKIISFTNIFVFLVIINFTCFRKYIHSSKNLLFLYNASWKPFNCNCYANKSSIFCEIGKVETDEENKCLCWLTDLSSWKDWQHIFTQANIVSIKQLYAYVKLTTKLTLQLLWKLYEENIHFITFANPSEPSN